MDINILRKFLSEINERYEKYFEEEEELEKRYANKNNAKDYLEEILNLKEKYKKLSDEYDDFLVENNDSITDEQYIEMNFVGRMLIDTNFRLSIKYFEKSLDILQNKQNERIEESNKNIDDVVDKVGEIQKDLKEITDKINNTESDALRKMSMFFSIFTLIASNIAVIFKAVDLRIHHFIALIIVINSIILLVVSLLFCLVDKIKYKGTAWLSGLGIVLGIAILFFYPKFNPESSYIENTIDKKITDKIERINTTTKNLEDKEEKLKKEIKLEVLNELLMEKKK